MLASLRGCEFIRTVVCSTAFRRNRAPKNPAKAGTTNIPSTSKSDLGINSQLATGGVAPLNHRLMADVVNDVVKSDLLFHVVLTRDGMNPRFCGR